MSYENKGKVISLLATADTKKYTAVKISADNTFAVAAASETVVGFLQNTVVAKEPGGVMVDGITFANAGETISAGDEVMPGADGVVLKAAAPATTGTNYGCGLAVNGGASGEIISVLIRPGKSYVKA